jgi:hypothetical protein
MTKLTPAPPSVNGSTARSVLGIQWGVSLLVEPALEFFTRSGRLDDLNVG